MKTLYESILDTEKDYDNDVLISVLFSKDIQQRRKAFESLLNLITSYNVKRQKTTTKMKNSDSYFVVFTRPYKNENGEAAEILNWISYIQLYKRIGSYYRTVRINAMEYSWGDKIEVHKLSWRHTQPDFNPKSSNTELYEVPEKLNDLFERIEMEAPNYK